MSNLRHWRARTTSATSSSTSATMQAGGRCRRAQGSLPRWWRGRRLGSVLQAELHPARPVRWRRDPTLPGRRWVRCLGAGRWHINRVWPRFSCRVCRGRRRGRCAPRRIHSQLVPRVIPRAAAEYLRYPHHALDAQCSSSKILLIRQGSEKVRGNWPTCLNS